MSAGRSWKRWALGLLFWTAVALFFSTQRYLAMGGGTDAFPEAILRSFPQWYLWGLLSPLVLRADRWAKGSGRPLRERILRHGPAAAVVVSLYVPVRTAIEDALGNVAAEWSFSGLGAQVHWNVLIYAVLAGAILAFDLDREAKERELRTSQLEARLAEARLETLKAQLRPHFLFNTLNAISAFVEKDPLTARRMTAHLGDLLRHSLDGAGRQEVPLAEELATVDDYLAIQSIRFSGRLEMERDVDPETLAAAVPSFLLQPLVENAIEHGLVPRAAPGRIRLQAERLDGSLRLTVSDDGPGLPPGWEANGKGFGLKNTAERLKALYGERASFSIGDGPSGGVTVKVTLPWRRS